MDRCAREPVGGSVGIDIDEYGKSYRDDESAIFALVIGVSQYISPDIAHLKGCVNDAKAVTKFLSGQLHVPDEHIVLLIDEAATRDAIISSFYDLIHNSMIQNGDAIIIYFAGHGSRAPGADGWLMIETILPHDMGMKNSQGDLIHAIPDRTINSLLRRLAAAKGNNISVIFDCCHAGGSTRELSSSMGSLRFTPTPYAMPENLDSDLFVDSRSANVKIPHGFIHKSMDSHVLLAACRTDEGAQEYVSPDGAVRGIFTYALLRQLQEDPLSQVTYSDLIRSLPQLQSQHPQCEGTYKHRLLFNGKAVGSDPKAFRFTKRSDDTFAIEAGSIHGVVVGTEFSVQSPGPEPLARETVAILKAVQVKALWSIVSRRPEDKEAYVAQEGKALVSDWKNNDSVLKVVVSSESDRQLAHALSLHKVTVRPTVKRQFVLVDDSSKADIALRQDPGGDLIIESLDPLVRMYPSKVVRFERPKRLERLPFILDAVAHFYYHLRRRGDDILGKSVRLELYRLTESNGSRVPDQQIGNLFTDISEANIVYDEDAEYGVAIINNSSHKLYPYLFYFDPSNYSIEPWYLPQASGTYPPLASTPLSIGYGESGGDPFDFFLHPGDMSDTGFLKLFVSTEYVEMDIIKQDAPALRAFARLKRLIDLDSSWASLVAAVTVYTEQGER